MLFRSLKALVADYPQVFAEVRGKGLLLGLVMAEKYLGKAKDITLAAEAEGLMLLIAGVDVIRIVPALIVTDRQIEEASRMLRKAVDAFLKTA